MDGLNKNIKRSTQIVVSKKFLWKFAGTQTLKMERKEKLQQDKALGESIKGPYVWQADLLVKIKQDYKK